MRALIRIGVTSRGTSSEFGIGIFWDMEYKDIVLKFGGYYVAFGKKTSAQETIVNHNQPSLKTAKKSEKVGNK